MNGRKPSIRRIVITVAVIYLVFCVCSCALQRRLLYFPTKIPADVIESVAAGHGFAPWKNAAGEIIGWKLAATNPATASVLIAHGNAGCALSRDYIAQPIHAMGAPVSDSARSNTATNAPGQETGAPNGVDVYVLEYPGYGARGGSPTRTSMVAAAEEGFALMPAGLPKYVVSESIGAGVACELAKNHPAEVAGMLLFVPYHNLAVVAQKHMWFLPAYFFLLDRFNPAESLKAYHAPVKFVIAGADEILGPQTGTKLYEGYNGPKDLQVVPHAGHNEVAGQAASWWREVFSWWEKNKT